MINDDRFPRIHGQEPPFLRIHGRFVPAVIHSRDHYKSKRIQYK